MGHTLAITHCAWILHKSPQIPYVLPMRRSLLPPRGYGFLICWTKSRPPKTIKCRIRGTLSHYSASNMRHHLMAHCVGFFSNLFKIDCHSNWVRATFSSRNITNDMDPQSITSISKSMDNYYNDAANDEFIPLFSRYKQPCLAHVILLDLSSLLPNHPQYTFPAKWLFLLNSNWILIDQIDTYFRMLQI